MVETANVRIVRVQTEPFEPAREVEVLTQGRRDIGALVTFAGLCRDEGGTLEALEIEHFPGMAEDEISRAARDAERRWPLQGVLVIHRFGLVKPGETIVMAATAASHRADAFAAAEFLMDYLKTAAPFWKKEHRRDGTTGDWVAAKAIDDLAASRWREL